MTSSDNVTRDPLLSDLVANHVAEAFRFWVSCFPGGVHTSADGVEMLETGISHPLGNVVLRCSLAGDAAVQKAMEIRQHFQEKGVIMSWFVQTHEELDKLPKVLTSAGFVVAGTAPAMLASLRGLPEDPVIKPGVEVREVLTGADLDSWIQTLQAVFQFSDELKPLFLGPCLKNGMGPDQQFRCFLASADGIAVGVSAIFRHQSEGGIFCVGTLPEVRGQGIGAVVTYAAMKAAADMGLERIVLQSSPLGESVYRKLGFQTVGNHERWSIKI